MSPAVSVLPARAPESGRLGATLTLSLLLHAMLLVGIGFTVSDPAALVPTLDVIFSQTSTPLTPKQADFLAQANQVGGGEDEAAQRPREPQAGFVPRSREGVAPLPQQARQQRLGGQVVITVGVRRDGSLESARVLRSSGTPLLDDAALRIVQLAQPFPPLPDTDDGVDILQVTRTWSFLPGGTLRDVDR